MVYDASCAVCHCKVNLTDLDDGVVDYCNQVMAKINYANFGIFEFICPYRRTEFLHHGILIIKPDVSTFLANLYKIRMKGAAALSFDRETGELNTVYAEDARNMLIAGNCPVMEL